MFEHSLTRCPHWACDATHFVENADGDRAKYVSIIHGLTFASPLITQQAGIFPGIMTRTFSTMSDLEIADLWVMDPVVQYLNDI